MKFTALLAALTAALGMASAVQAQDASATATYGSVRLSAGFTPDPHSISLTAGGSIDATNIGSPCRGSIARAPDYEVTYTSGSMPLYFYVNATSDTTLVVNGPDGRWYCDDDSNGGVNPQVTFNTPRSGTYDIWVGTYGGGTTPATLFVTELSTDGGNGNTNNSGGYPNASLRATFGEITLNSGFQPDPRRVSLTAGGNIPASNVSSSCTGSIATAPDYQITYNAGSLPLSIRTEAGRDTTLVVNGPDGQWYCDDDSAGSTNARVYFAKPASGTYDIWVGTYGGGTTPATLIVTELD
ncbi:hypothetical protein GCM10009422_03140 [Brevundimonas kwangchunensis]|uniref:Peptidase S1 n=1 Tax=Brevundimonas kwangchunensis TaxID=322163 RepID=A0ABN1GHE3_9CAUL